MAATGACDKILGHDSPTFKTCGVDPLGILTQGGGHNHKMAAGRD